MDSYMKFLIGWVRSTYKRLEALDNMYGPNDTLYRLTAEELERAEAMRENYAAYLEMESRKS